MIALLMTQDILIILSDIAVCMPKSRSNPMPN